jgi:transcriptional repressor NrdR
LFCGARFTTYERIITKDLFVVKKDGRRELYHREKITSGMRKACEKRPLPTGALEKSIDNIEAAIHHLGKAEISSSYIGDLVMQELKQLDHIAYVRFASVYREFGDIETFKQILDSLTPDEASSLSKEVSSLASSATNKVNPS